MYIISREKFHWLKLRWHAQNPPKMYFQYTPLTLKLLLLLLDIIIYADFHLITMEHCTSILELFFIFILYFCSHFFCIVWLCSHCLFVCLSACSVCLFCLLMNKHVHLLCNCVKAVIFWCIRGCMLLSKILQVITRFCWENVHSLLLVISVLICKYDSWCLWLCWC